MQRGKTGDGSVSCPNITQTTEPTLIFCKKAMCCMRSLSSLPRSGREGDRPYTDFLVKFSDKRDIKCLLQSCFVGVVEGV